VYYITQFDGILKEFYDINETVGTLELNLQQQTQSKFKLNLAWIEMMLLIEYLKMVLTHFKAH